jgi:small-conductance mechanosensitive channel
MREDTINRESVARPVRAPRSKGRGSVPLMVLVLVALLLGVVVVPDGSAQAPDTTATAATEQGAATPAGPEGASQQSETAELLLNNRPITTFRAWVGARGPRERADGALKRIEAVASVRESGAVTARKIPEGMLVLIGQTPVFSITPGDVDTLAGETIEQKTSRAVTHLQVAFNEEHEQRSTATLLRAVGLSVVATLVFILLMRWLLAARRAVLYRFLKQRTARFQEIKLAGFTIVESGQVVTVLRGVVGLLSLSVGLFLTYVWLTFLLRRFPYSRPWGEALGSFLLTTFQDLALGALRAVPGLFVAVVIIFVARLVARLVVGFFDAIDRGEVQVALVPQEIAKPTKPIALVLVWMFAIAVAYPYIPGSSSDIFKGLSVFLGVLVSLGSSGLVNQAMAGISLMYSRALKPGDYVLVSGTEGTVTSFGLLATKITTNKREEVTIPNAVVLGNITKNYSRPGDEDGVILHTSVTIGYDAPWRQVHAMLMAAAEKTPGLRHAPKPFVRQRNLADFYVEYEINAHMEDPHERINVLSTLNANIQDTFNEHGVQIMSPHFVAQPAETVVVPKDKWAPPPATSD